jgi:hypothetical protein
MPAYLKPIIMIAIYEVLKSVYFEFVERLMCFGKVIQNIVEGFSTNGSNIKKPNQ